MLLVFCLSEKFKKARMEQNPGWFGGSFLVSEKPLGGWCEGVVSKAFYQKKELLVDFVRKIWAPAILLLELLAWC